MFQHYGERMSYLFRRDKEELSSPKKNAAEFDCVFYP